VTILEGVGLGALQGVTEFLPISSSGHLVLARALFGIHEAPVTMNVLLHVASLVAIVVFFRREVASLVTTRRGLLPVLVVGTVPAAVVGILLRGRLEWLFQNPAGAGLGLLLTGLVLVASERMSVPQRSLDDLRLGDGLWVGIAQAIALAPGVSRSGMTIGAGLASGLERGAAVAFAFLLGMVAIAGAAVLKAQDMVELGAANPAALACGFGASLATSLASLAFLTQIVRRKCLSLFAIYCFLVGGAVLLAKATGMW